MTLVFVLQLDRKEDEEDKCEGSVAAGRRGSVVASIVERTHHGGRGEREPVGGGGERQQQQQQQRVRLLHRDTGHPHDPVARHPHTRHYHW